MVKRLNDRIKYSVFILTYTVCLLLLILPQYSNFLYSSSISTKDPTLEQLAIESVKVRYIGGDKSMLDKIFTSDFIKKLGDDERSSFYKNKIFYDIDRSSFIKETDSNSGAVYLNITVHDSSGVYYQILPLEMQPDGNYLISDVQIDI
jgi:hypothetical protein